MPLRGELQEDQLRWMAEEHPDEVAYRNLASGASLTFREWDADSDALARFFVHRGIRRGDRVAVLAPGADALRWIVAYAAVHKAGAVVVPANTRLSAPELVTVLGHAEVAGIVAAPGHMDDAATVAHAVPTVRVTVSTADRSDHPAVVGWRDALALDSGPLPPPPELDDLADVMYTSGTTGLPKGVAVRHRNVATVPNNEAPWSGSGWLHSAPLFTFAGIAFVYAPMKLGMAALYMPRFDAGLWLNAVAREHPTMTFLVPSMAELLVTHPGFADADLSSLALVAIGSAPIAPATLRTLQDRLPGASVSNSYGMTEAGPAFLSLPREETYRRAGSVGRPQPPLEVRIVDDAGVDMTVGDVGELWTRMPGRRREYFRDPEATAATWTPDGWLRSGDLARLDEGGYLYLVGRKKDLIIRGGHNVYPTDVEAVLLEHPGVQEAAVAGIPHAVLGEDVAAWVVPAPGTLLTPAEILAFCRARLADYKCPRTVTIAGALPRNATGKVLKHVLTGDAGHRGS